MNGGGHIYVLVNRALPGLVKVGMTSRSPEDRARELSGTALPWPFEVAFSMEVRDRRAVERALHRRLAPFRVRYGREFFRLDAGQARRLVEREAVTFRRRSRGRGLVLAALATAVAAAAFAFSLGQGLTPIQATAAGAACAAALTACCLGTPRGKRLRPRRVRGRARPRPRG